MTRPTPQPGDIWQHWQGRLYKIVSVEGDRVQYAPANAPNSPLIHCASDRLDWFLGTSPINSSVNRFEFVEGDSNE